MKWIKLTNIHDGRLILVNVQQICWIKDTKPGAIVWVDGKALEVMESVESIQLMLEVSNI